MALTEQDIVKGLQKLGLPAGGAVMVHSALSSFGEVAGGAETVIAALLQAIGPEGTLLMPAMAWGGLFQVDSSPSRVGLITETFRSHPGAIRSLHPTHSVTGLGPLAETLIQSHLDQPTAIGMESPWGRLAQRDDGYILFLGVDQDRNTLLHVAEEMVGSVYLNTIAREYVDTDGRQQRKVLEQYPGPHRDFIGLDSLFEQAGIMKIGKIGNAVCRLMQARQMLELTVAALQADPAAVLCDNPHCRDCVLQRAAIKRDRLSREDFTLSAVIDDIGFAPEDADRALWLAGAEGIGHIEIGAEWAKRLAEDATLRRDLATALADAGMAVSIYYADVPMTDEAPVAEAVAALEAAIEASTLFAPEYLKLPACPRGQGTETAASRAHPQQLLAALAETATSAQVKLLIENDPAAAWGDTESCQEILEAVNSPALSFSFNPAHFVHAGEHPFLGAYTHSKLKRHTAQIMLVDGCAPPWLQYTLVGRGQGEVKELISIFRCRSFAGHLTLGRSGERTPENFTEQARAFWHLLTNM